MGIFKRIKNITMNEVHDLLDKVEDPISMLNQSMREMEEEVSKGQQAYAHQLFLEKKQMALIADTHAIIAKRERQAKLAVDKGEEPIAKMALQEKINQEKTLNLYKEQYETIINQTKSLVEKVNELKDKYSELQNRRLLLLSRANVAQSIKQMNHMVVSFNTDNIAKGFACAEERVLLLEAEVEASNRLLHHPQDIHTFSFDPVLQQEVEKELEKLKGTQKETV
ncbi:PspA/IM30 family protein [Aneurinibacillus tyrosinisolvens]|uniref:PspA/IM30 family protein n=1 Tax=Aneurinibacillus tyrosinisolvens TaxID=1443435 RepID=UPI00063F2FE2|nr:PspA/IM30 family protein [Aneurinibacillus tyrosinisolvens]